MKNRAIMKRTYSKRWGKMKRKRRALTYYGAVGIALVIIYVVGVIFFNSHFKANTYFGRENVSFMTAQQANSKLAHHFSGEKYYLIEGERHITSFKPGDIGVSFSGEGRMGEVLKEDNPFIWPLSFFSKKRVIRVDDIYDKILTVDQDKVSAYVRDLGIDNKGREASKNATVAYKDGKFQIVAEKIGHQVDLKALEKNLVMTTLKDSKTVDLQNSYRQPEVKSDNKQLIEQADKLNKRIDLDVKVKIKDKEEKIPASEISKWFTVGEDFSIRVNYDGIWAFAQKYSDEHGTINKPRQFHATRQGNIEVPAGTLGWSLDVDGMAKQIYKIAEEGKGAVVEATIVGSGKHEANDIGNTYVEVSIPDQMLWYYQDGKIVFQTPIVTGHPQSPTVRGVFYVWNKEQNTVLEGVNRRTGNKYKSPVSYWMPFNWSGFGLHDSPWQPAYGGNNWQWAGSNGCVNIPPEVMGQFFNMVAIGTPVIVY